MDKALLILKIISAILGSLSALLGVILGTKSSKLKSIFTKVNAVTEQTQVIISLIEDAEKKANYSGDEKLNYVITRYMQYCSENKIKFNLDDAKIQIEQLIAMSKEVNNNNIDKFRLK